MTFPPISHHNESLDTFLLVSLLGESLEPLEGVVDEDPVLVGLTGLRVGGDGDLQVDVGELVEVRGVIDGLHPDHDGSRPLPGKGQD